MELREGYKQTEVGVVPEDWRVDNLGQFWSVKDCKHVTAKFVQNGFPLASIREVQSRFVDLTKAKQTTKKFYDLLIEGGRKPRSGDLILSRNATVGEVAQVTETHSLFAMGQDVCLLRKKSTKYSTEYLQAIFQSPIVQNQLIDLMVGSTFKRANVEQIRNFSVPMPLPSEQRAIATALSDMDALLEGLDQLIAKKRDLKQATMQQLLTGKTRLPGFCAGTRLSGDARDGKESIEGEWEVKRLGDHIKFLRNGVNSRAELNFSDSVKYLHYGDIHACSGAEMSPQGLPSLPLEKTKTLDRLQAGDLVFADASEDMDGVGKSVEICEVGSVEFVSGLHTIAVRFDKAILADGFKAYLQFCPEFIGHLHKLAAGTKVYATNRAHIASVEMHLPKTEEQTAIATILSDMDAEIQALKQRRNKTRDLKQAMMQELLTGKTRLISNREK